MKQATGDACNNLLAAAKNMLACLDDADALADEAGNEYRDVRILRGAIATAETEGMGSEDGTHTTRSES